MIHLLLLHVLRQRHQSCTFLVLSFLLQLLGLCQNLLDIVSRLLDLLLEVLQYSSVGRRQWLRVRVQTTAIPVDLKVNLSDKALELRQDISLFAPLRLVPLGPKFLLVFIVVFLLTETEV